ncbi:hypothetical protein HPB49_013556 [Dermacentor silvarum]|uniref:Uncharacterized protein n=1 Tax=Dermacentor silvarum TaxID=543639 RepID=A0ACB8CL03_DERSI|nr:hypothetical protein HPB49_013556 [Dermacentor silvarum]
MARLVSVVCHVARAREEEAVALHGLSAEDLLVFRRRFPQQMPNDEAASSSGPRAVGALFVLLAPPLLSALVALVWILMHDSTGSNGELPEIPPFCCPDATETIMTLSNLSNDPCTDFFSYACYKKSGVDRRAIAVRAFRSVVVHPTLQATLRSPVSDIIWANHKSCLIAAVKNLFTAEDAVEAVIDLFRRWSGTSTSSPGNVDLIKLVGLLHFRYEIFSVFNAYYKSSFEKNEATYIIYFQHAPHIDFEASSAEDAMLEAAKRHAGMSASSADVLNVIRRFRRARKTSDDEHSIVPMPLLDEHFPKEGISSWQEILRAVPVIAIENPPDVTAVLNILTDQNTLVQEAAQLYFAVHATLSTFYEEIAQAASLADHAALCEYLTMELYPLWDVLATQRMTSPDRDQVVLEMFNRVSEAVIADAQVLFSAHLHANEVQNAVRSIHIVLPGNLTAPYKRYLPFISEDYFENKFEIRSSYYQISSSNALRGLYGLYRLRVDLSRIFLSRFDNQIAVAASVYALLSFGKETAAINRSTADGADVINAAVLGVMLANALWDKIFDDVKRDIDRWKGLVDYLYCIQRQAEDALYTELKYPILSLSSTVRAFATPRWHHRAPVFGFHSLSASQVFFILFFVHHACISTGYDGSGMRASTLMRNFEEFLKAFGCAGKPIRNVMGACEKREGG